MTKLEKILNARVNYLQYVYENHVVRLDNKPMILPKKMMLAANRADKETALKYLEVCDPKEKKIAEQFVKDYHNMFIFIEMKSNKVTLYSREEDKIYLVNITDLDDRLLLATLSKYNEISTTIMNIDDKLYLDVSTSFPDKQKTLYNAYRLSEHVDKLLKK